MSSSPTPHAPCTADARIEGAAAPAAPSNSQLPQRRLDARGRYNPRGPISSRRIQRCIQQRESVKRKTALKRLLFEKFLHSFCIEGNESDSLPAARSTGPLVEIFESMLRPNFILGRPERYSRTRQLYKDGGHLRNGSYADPENASTRRTPRRTSINPKKYVGCRLPIVSRRIEEMASVRAFFDFAAENNALAYSVEQGMKICEEMMELYRSGSTSSQRVATQGLVQSQQNTVCSNCRVRLSDGSSGSRSQIRSPDQNAHLPSRREDNIGEPQDLQGPLPSRLEDNVGEPQDCQKPLTMGGPRDDTGAEVSHTPHTSDENRARSRKLQAVVETAKIDDNFLMVCMLFDEHLESDFGVFSRSFLEEHRRQGIEPENLIKEVLLFAQSRRNGTIESSEHREREKQLRVTMQLFEAARGSLGLPSYREMRWDFLER